MTANLPANPLAAVVAAARRGLPAATGATEQAARVAALGGPPVVLADVSQSMWERVGGRSKYEHLRAALMDLPHGAQIIAFASDASVVASAASLPRPGGSTALHLALAAAASSKPRRLLVISDGHPDDANLALAAADRLAPARIDVLYIGSDSDRAGMAFMRRLARAGGAATHHDLARASTQLTQAVRVLALGAPR